MSNRLARRVAGFGTTIFTEMSALAVQHGAVNLGQGFPISPAPISSNRPPPPRSPPT